jgi:hypothetical protein
VIKKGKMFLSPQGKIYLLEQLNPFPEYPTLHSQSKEPSLSVQVALG